MAGTIPPFTPSGAVGICNRLPPSGTLGCIGVVGSMTGGAPNGVAGSIAPMGVDGGRPAAPAPPSTGTGTAGDVGAAAGACQRSPVVPGAAAAAVRSRSARRSWIAAPSASCAWSNMSTFVTSASMHVRTCIKLPWYKRSRALSPSSHAQRSASDDEAPGGGSAGSGRGNP